jgi:hypothetical protein
MSEFSSNSAFHEDQRARESREADRSFPVRHVGRPNIIEIPVSVLEDWMAELDNAVNGGITDPEPELQEVLEQMSTYFRG